MDFGAIFLHSSAHWFQNRTIGNRLHRWTIILLFSRMVLFCAVFILWTRSISSVQVDGALPFVLQSSPPASVDSSNGATRLWIAWDERSWKLRCNRREDVPDLPWNERERCHQFLSSVLLQHGFKLQVRLLSVPRDSPRWSLPLHNFQNVR